MAVRILRRSSAVATAALSLAACGTEQGRIDPGSGGSTAVEYTTTPGTESVPTTGSGETPQSIAVTVDLGTSIAEATSDTVYSAKFDDPNWGLLPADDMMTGIAGFGVDATGAVHIVDGSRHRVIVVAADRTMTAVALPVELEKDLIRGFAVGPDGVTYLTLNDGAAAVKGSALLGRFSSAEIGWDSVPLRPVATQDGMWVLLANEWRLTLSPTGNLVRDTVQVAGAEARPDGSSIEVRYDGATAELKGANADGLAFDVTVNNIEGGGPYLQQFVGKDLLWILQPSHEELLAVVVRTDGTYSVSRIPIPPENRVAGGLYVKVAEGSVWLETGDATTVMVRRITLTDLGAAE